MLLQNEIKMIEKYLRDKSTWKHEIEILLLLFNHKKIKNDFFQNPDVDDLQKKKIALENLIQKNVVRETSSECGSIYEFHSPKYRLAIKIWKEENEKFL